jgi:hypothetical protein
MNNILNNFGGSPGLALVAGAIILLVGIIIVFTVRRKETFVPEFLDQGNVKQTAKTSTSSYAQETNHFKLTPPIPEPIEGVQTPFRVNMFNSYAV